jgi:putative membrane protein
MQIRAMRIVHTLIAGFLLATAGVGGAMPQTKDASQQATKIYVQQASIGDLFRIEASKLAKEKSADPVIRVFAEENIAEHSKATRRLKDLLANAQLESQLPTGLDKDHEAKLDELRKMQGPEFDRAYLDMQLKGHENALTLHQTYARAGQTEPLRAFANDTAQTVERHLVELRGLSKTAAGRS